jgi:hypothetical protein
MTSALMLTGVPDVMLDAVKLRPLIREEIFEG